MGQYTERSPMVFKNELQFENELVKLLSNNGWEKEVIKNPTEKDLLANWAEILLENNRSIDRLNDCPLTETEMQQIVEQITTLRTPLKMNGFINGKTVSIKRDNPDDKLHYGKEISLKIYDRREIAAGQSRYQIVQQPRFEKRNKILNDRRGDIMLLINGMPVFHIELKASGVPVSQATNQIEKYAHEGVYRGIFSLVQIFVAMNPGDTVYFANPGPDGKFNADYFFHWADFDNEPVNDYGSIVKNVLSIPMAHKLIGFYTVADDTDGVLKVMRSYQYHAANAISDKVSKHDWSLTSPRGGFIWHTTGSGKTMTSFKSAQLIANSGDADKVVFLTDRVELGTQSLKEYNAFAEDGESVQGTENTDELISRLKSNNTADILILTSIHKMSNIYNKEDAIKDISYDIELIGNKRVVFIIDEAHRSTFGEMLSIIKETFPRALYFGFTGTPIHDENQKNMNTTASIFGDELHRYSIADGIRDKNVLGFDPYKVLTFKDRDVRKKVALEQAKADTEEDAISDNLKSEIFYKYMDSSKVKMCRMDNEAGKAEKGIEDFLSNAQYNSEVHRETVVRDMKENYVTLSHNYKFHAMFATSSIPEAIKYYQLMKEKMPELKVTCLFDQHIDNNEGAIAKEEGLVEIIEDYNKRYGVDFSIPTFSFMKKDIASRLAHKGVYKGIERDASKQLDLLIVVDQMLTGFDSKWINTLYMDKQMSYENIIQAFSRTNRLFGPDKPFGTIRYYRKPHTMEQNVAKAVKAYSGDKPVILFVEKLGFNLKLINEIYEDIQAIFRVAEIPNMEKLPVDKAACGEFAEKFKELNSHLEAARLQGFSWNSLEYELDVPSTEGHEGDELEKETITVNIEYNKFMGLASRYKELAEKIEETKTKKDTNVPYDLVGYLTEIDTGKIDASYMNSTFEKYLRLKEQDSDTMELLDDTLAELHKTFATLSQEEQKFAEIFMRDIDKGNVIPEAGKTLREYITEYQSQDHDDKVTDCVKFLGVDEKKLRNLMSLGLTEANIDEFGRFTELKETVDKALAKSYFEQREGMKLIPPKVNMKVDKLLREFVLGDGIEM